MPADEPLPGVEDPAVAAAIVRLDAGEPQAADLRLLTKHYLQRLAVRAPGRAVEVRVPPYAAVQCLGGPRHTRGIPGAVVETDARTWIALARGTRRWDDAVAGGDVRASGERTELSGLLPLK